MHLVKEVAISCSENSYFGIVIRLFPVKPDINWFSLSTVVVAAFQIKRLESSEALYFTNEGASTSREHRQKLR